MMRKSFLGLAGAVLGAALAAALSASAQAAPMTCSRVTAEQISVSGGFVQKAVTRAGVYHRSARRTSRRVYRRHHYY
jgi:hypothetical protein